MSTTYSPLPTLNLFSAAIELAQAAFTDPRPRGLGCPAAASVPASDPARGWLERLDSWFWKQEQRHRDAYLAQSSDIFDLENRIRQLERRGYS